MKMTVDGFDFEFEDAIDVFVFDEKDKNLPNYHGLSHAMKAVDLIVELENDYLFIEVKDFNEPDDYFDGNYFNHLREVLKQKYRDTFLYRWAENKINKPIRYLCLLTLDNALTSRMNKEIKKQLPVGRPISRWEKAIAQSSVVVNIDRWNHNFPKWPVNRS
ncbi:hypothetical protein [Desulfobacula sp.]|uniref:hypothetical protein n=1 Tax=Desulfobacula sp. TaxID=2593537 RepID=UPI002612D9E0|nr:hypothetical protein [Desulfobacula sp.]